MFGVPRPDADKAPPAAAEQLNVAAKYTNPQGMHTATRATAVKHHKPLETHPQQPTGNPEQHF
jgi:hypothetical protein